MKAVRFTPGAPTNLYISEKESIPEPKAKEVQIRIVATAINRADTLQVQINFALNVMMMMMKCINKR